ncbi:unnamed protein product [Peniophora sp. CBMAI 1063]|nr:unnamed protein product [Peniophora sp. CBMAI 1063]
MSSGSGQLETNPTSGMQCTVYIDEETKPGTCVCGHTFNYHTVAARSDPFAMLPANRAPRTASSTSTALDDTLGGHEDEEEDRLAEVRRRFEKARSQGTADAAGRSSLAYHAPAAGSARSQVSHADALAEARQGLSGGDRGKGKGKGKGSSGSGKSKEKKEKPGKTKGKADGGKSKSQGSSGLKPLRVCEVYFVPVGLKQYSCVPLASGGVTYNAEIGTTLHEWEDLIGIRLPESVLNGRNVIDGVVLCLRQEGLAAVAKDDPEFRSDGYFTFGQTSQAEIDMFVCSLLPKGFSLLDSDLANNPPAGYKKRAKPEGPLDWVVLKVAYNKIHVVDHHSVIDVEFLRRFATSPSHAYSRVPLASGGVTYDAEIGTNLHEWEDLIGIRLPESVLDGRDVIDGVVLRLRQEGLAAVAKDDPEFRSDGYFTFGQTSQAEIDMFVRSLLPKGFSLLDSDLANNPPAGYEKRAKPEGSLDWVVLKVAYNKIHVVDHHSVIDVEFLRRFATSPSHAVRERLFIAPRRRVVLDPGLRLAGSPLSDNDSDNEHGSLGSHSDTSDRSRHSDDEAPSVKGKGKAVATSSRTLRSQHRKSSEVVIDFDDYTLSDDANDDASYNYFDDGLRGDGGYSSGSDGLLLSAEQDATVSRGISPSGSTKRPRSISPTSTIEDVPESSTAARKRRREGTITNRTLEESSRTLSQLTVEDDEEVAPLQPPSSNRLARAESENKRIDRIQDVWANLRGK